MNNSTDQSLEDDETITVSSTGMMTPGSTITHCLDKWETQEPTVVVIMDVDCYGNGVRLQIKMRTNMPFGKVAALLKTKYQGTDLFQLRFDGLHELQDKSGHRMIFNSDTPASLGLEDHTVLRFEHPRGTQALDMTIL